MFQTTILLKWELVSSKSLRERKNFGKSVEQLQEIIFIIFHIKIVNINIFETEDIITIVKVLGIRWYFWGGFVFSLAKKEHFETGEKTEKMKTNTNQPPINNFFEIVNHIIF